MAHLMYTMPLKFCAWVAITCKTFLHTLPDYVIIKKCKKYSGGYFMNKKRIVLSLFLCVLLFSFAGCSSNKNQENTIFDVVERAPEFPGGMEACLKYMYKNIKYPAVAMEAGIQGQVVIQIVIDKDGKIHDPKIVRGVSPELNAEAIRVISNMPQWIPGKQKGKNVATRFTLPVRFRLA